MSVVLYAGYASASAPMGPAPKDAQEAFDWSDAVFVGKAVDIQKDSYGFFSIAVVRIDEVWKGKGLPSQVHVDGTGGPTYPARLFTDGQRYVFYVDYSSKDTLRYIHREKRDESSYPGGSLRADSFLHRVVPVEEASDDLTFLSRKPSYKP